MICVLRFLHLASVSFWTGSTLFLFVLAPGVFGALPRAVAGEAMNAIFPRYYALCYTCAALALATHFLLPERSAARLGVLSGATALLMFAGLVLGPRATSLRLAMNAAETAGVKDAPAAAALRSRFGRMHGVVMTVDSTMFALGISLLWMSVAPLAPKALSTLNQPPAGEAPGGPAS